MLPAVKPIGSLVQPAKPNQTQKDAYYDLVVDGDLAKLTPEQRVKYLTSVAESMGLNPMTRPFGLISLDKKVTLYALKEASTQLAKRDNVSVSLGEYQFIKERGILMVSVTARSPDGRTTDDVAALPLGEKAMGEAAANAYMKLATKAKRRAILTHCGLGMLDESELDTIKDWKKIDDTIETKKEKQTNEEGITKLSSPEADRPDQAEDVSCNTEVLSNAFNYSGTEDRQWLIDVVKKIFPAIQRADALQICGTFAKASTKSGIMQILQDRLAHERSLGANSKLLKD